MISTPRRLERVSKGGLRFDGYVDCGLDWGGELWLGCAESSTSFGFPSYLWLSTRTPDARVD